MAIIAFAGRAGHGKDTAASVLVERGFKQLAFAGALKDACKIVFNLTDEELNDRLLKEKPLERWPFVSPGAILQRVGTEMFRDNYPGVWIESLRQKAANENNVVVTDCRFIDEAEAIHAMGGKVIKIVRPGGPWSTRDPNHPSEATVDLLPVDITFTNDYRSAETFKSMVAGWLMSMGIIQ